MISFIDSAPCEPTTSRPLCLMSNSANARIRIPNRLGMHARPAMMFVTCASEFEAAVTVRRVDSADEAFDGKSIMQVMMLAATQGTEIDISAEGSDAEQAVKALVELVESGFQED